MWFVSKLPFRQTLKVLATPGKGFAALQLANAHWSWGISSRASFWCTRRVSVAPRLSVLTASYPGGGVTGGVLGPGAVLKMYSDRTRPVIAPPCRLNARGKETLIL